MYSQNTDVLGKYAIMEAWWCIVSGDREQDKTSCAGKSKELHSQLHRYEGMQLLTCGSDKFGPEAFEIHTYDTKNRAARGRRGDN